MPVSTPRTVAVKKAWKGREERVLMFNRNLLVPSHKETRNEKVTGCKTSLPAVIVNSK
jgi:hypothetical protein